MKLNLGYITGLNGSKNVGLAKFLSDNYKANIIALDKGFQAVPIEEQVQLKSDSFKGCTHIIANSYGAYLFMNSLSERCYKNVKVLLLSPVLGPVFMKGGGRIPKGYAHFKKRISKYKHTSAEQIDIVFGEEDEHFSLKGLELIQSSELKVRLTKLDKQGHRIDHILVKETLSDFLN